MKKLINDLKELYYALGRSSENITPILKKYSYIFNWKAYGTPELELKYLHGIFLDLQEQHPAFSSISWEQSNDYNDNYYHFTLDNFMVNKDLSINSDIDFYFRFDEEDKMRTYIRFETYDYPGEDEKEFAAAHNLPLKEYGLDSPHLEKFWEYQDKKYQHLKAPCLNFLAVLKMLEMNCGMYYFLYSFGNAVRVHFDKDGVSITKLKEGEYEGVPLGTEMF